MSDDGVVAGSLLHDAGQLASANARSPKSVFERGNITNSGFI